MFQVAVKPSRPEEIYLLSHDPTIIVVVVVVVVAEVVEIVVVVIVV